MIGRPPHDPDAEQAVIGGILFAGRIPPEVLELVQAEDFYHPALQSVYQAALDLDEESQPADVITVADQMRRSETIAKLGPLGGPVYLSELANRVATVENIGTHAEIVREKAMLRRLILLGGAIVQRGQGQDPVDAQLDQAEGELLAISLVATTQAVQSGRKVLHQVMRDLDARMKAREPITGVPTGFVRLDEMTAGLQASDLVILAARPSMGKTAFVMNCGVFAAVEHRIPVLTFSLEMSSPQLMQRAICTEARVESQRLRTGYVESRDLINLAKATARVADAPLFLDDSPGTTLQMIRARARRWRRDRAIFPRGLADKGLVIVDYLQLIRPPKVAGKSQPNREREISEISRGLKELAKELHVPVVALSQLNRGLESRADKRPGPADLRESGALEQDADVIAFIYRDEVYNKESPDAGVAEIIIAKHRNGPTGTVRLAFLNQYTRFENLAAGYREDAA